MCERFAARHLSPPGLTADLDVLSLERRLKGLIGKEDDG